MTNHPKSPLHSKPEKFKAQAEMERQHGEVQATTPAEEKK